MTNQIKTILLMGALTALVIAIGALVAPGQLYLFAAIALAMNLGAYFFSDRVVLRLHHAREVTATDAPELHAIVDELAKEGISIEIVDLRTVFPLDEEAVLASVRKTSKAILLHEDILSGGVGGEIAARIAEKAFDHLDGPVVRIAAPDTPVPFSPPLEQTFLPSVPKVMEKARWLYNY